MMKQLKEEMDNAEAYEPIPVEVWSLKKSRSLQQIKNDYMAVLIFLKLSLKHINSRVKNGLVSQEMVNRGFNLGSKPAEKASAKYSSLMKAYRMLKEKLKRNEKHFSDLPIYFPLLEEMKGTGDEDNASDGYVSDAPEVTADQNTDDQDLEECKVILDGYTPIDEEVWAPLPKSQNQWKNDEMATKILLNVLKKTKKADRFSRAAWVLTTLGFNMTLKSVDKCKWKFKNLSRMYQMNKKQLMEPEKLGKDLPAYFWDMHQISRDSEEDDEVSIELRSANNVESEDLVDIAQKTLAGYEPAKCEIWTHAKHGLLNPVNDKMATIVLMRLLKATHRVKHRFVVISQTMQEVGFNAGKNPNDKVHGKYQNLVKKFKKFLTRVSSGGSVSDAPPFMKDIWEIQQKKPKGLFEDVDLPVVNEEESDDDDHTGFYFTDSPEVSVNEASDFCDVSISDSYEPRETEIPDPSGSVNFSFSDIDASTLSLAQKQRQIAQSRTQMIARDQSPTVEEEEERYPSFKKCKIDRTSTRLSTRQISTLTSEKSIDSCLVSECLDRLDRLEERQCRLEEKTEKFFEAIQTEIRMEKERRIRVETIQNKKFDKILEMLSSISKAQR
ncbi:uncharacterized protein LOC136030068 isoform X2 [Artemia franciscana]|nr:hypothetical protein QYM36_016344 [Artemia franciscana]KAK2706271.1 hypothetical protein QYM36_016344 [Artemia franciscana]KAK2706272.1 hypothetical protein QYM36_016344 [Artemia franciscana]